MKFEFLVAMRYLRAKRKQSVISLITLIAILGVGAGVAALVVALAVSEGQRQDIQNRLLGTQAHITILHEDPEKGIVDYEDLAKEIEQVEGVVGASPHSELGMAISPELVPVLVKGIIPDLESKVSQLPQNILTGQLSELHGNHIVIGKELANMRGLALGDTVQIMSPVMEAGAAGLQHVTLGFRVVAIYSVGLF